jgi:hypothetical protein
MGSLDLLVSNGCRIVGVFAANCIRLDVRLDTIPSVLSEYKPLPVVRCVKNKYLLSRLFFAGLAPQIADFWCIDTRQKIAAQSCLFWTFAGQINC